MTAFSTENHKNLMLFSGRAHPELAEAVAKELNVHVTPQTARDFANGETFVRFEESVRGSDAFVLQSFPAPLNQWVMEHLIMIDALKRGSAKRITSVLPFYPYARQDKKHRGREPISARLIADLLKTAGVDRIITVDLHTDQIQGFFDGPVDHMHAQVQLAEHIRNNYALDNIAVVSPDAGRVKVAEKWANSLSDAPLAFIHKTRDPLVANQVVANRVVGEVEGRTCILIDDMIDTGGTIMRRGQGAQGGGRGRCRHRRHARHPQPPGRRAAGELWRQGGRGHQYAAHRRGQEVPDADRTVDRAAAGADHP